MFDYVPSPVSTHTHTQNGDDTIQSFDIITTLTLNLRAASLQRSGTAKRVKVTKLFNNNNKYVSIWWDTAFIYSSSFIFAVSRTSVPLVKQSCCDTLSPI